MRAKHSPRQSKQEDQNTSYLAPQPFGYVLSIRRAQKRLLTKAVPLGQEVKSSQSLGVPAANTGSAQQRKAKCKRPSRHLLLRSTCRWHAFACKRRHPTHNAGWQWCIVRCLTLPSRGRFPAYGLQAPLMSNVRRHQIPCNAKTLFHSITP